MGSPEGQKPLDVELGDVDETKQLNPDVKIDDVEKSEERKFTGLKKEELLEISSQPKWVRARWALFIIFWLVWVGMLVGAILIVVNAPKCKPEPTPQWYQDNVVYEADVGKFANDFKAMEDHLPYVQSLKSNVLLAVGAVSRQDPEKVSGSEEAFGSLVAQAHDRGMKVMVDLPIEAFSTSIEKFQGSASASCSGSSPSGTDCDLFIWNTDNTSSGDYQWVRDNTRGEFYKAVATNSGLAYLNYNETAAINYVSSIVGMWLNRGVDGIQLRDMAKLASGYPTALVNGIWEQNFADKNETRALYLYASDAEVASSLQSAEPGVNETNTKPAVVVVFEPVTNVATTNVGATIATNLETWRNASRNIVAYTASPLSKELTATRMDYNHSTGLNLLVLSLPGVPIIRSGDELSATSDQFDWTAVELKDSVPTAAQNDTNLKALKTTRQGATLRVAGIQAILSLRYDTRDQDTKFFFIDDGSDEVISFCRQWAYKPTVLVVSNLGAEPASVNVAHDQCLLKDNKAAKSAKVLLSSSKSFEPGSAVTDIEKLQLPAGATLLLQDA